MPLHPSRSCLHQKHFMDCLLNSSSRNSFVQTAGKSLRIKSIRLRSSSFGLPTIKDIRTCPPRRPCPCTLYQSLPVAGRRRGRFLKIAAPSVQTYPFAPSVAGLLSALGREPSQPYLPLSWPVVCVAAVAP